MPDGSNDNRAIYNVEDDAPVTNPQPRPGIALETLHVALSSLCVCPELVIKPPPHIGREPTPLPGSRSGKDNLHRGYTMECDIIVKTNIANRDNRMLL
jgi:hypothetical protein